MKQAAGEAPAAGLTRGVSAAPNGFASAEGAMPNSAQSADNVDLALDYANRR
jgi:hypothetical protein